MTKTFIISDTHFGHKNILSFKDKEGTPLRPGFSSIKEHDDYLITQWNSVVKPEDRVFHLGDVCMCSFTRLKYIMESLNGTKVLIKGNHDQYKLSQYASIFKDIRSIHSLDKHQFVLTHIPLHPSCLDRWGFNIHGHLHKRTLPLPYVNVSVECLDNYRPINFEELRSKLPNVREFKEEWNRNRLLDNL